MDPSAQQPQQGISEGHIRGVNHHHHRDIEKGEEYE